MAKKPNYSYLDDDKDGYKDYPLQSVEETEDKHENKFAKESTRADKKQKGEPKDDYSNLNMKEPSDADLSVELDEHEKAELIKQVENEYQYSRDYMMPKIQQWLMRLKLFNNQRREADKVGDPLMFTIFQTVLAALYDDQMLIEWVGKEEGDSDAADNLNALATYDFDMMSKDILDYDWMWDAAFFGRGIVSFTTFDRYSLTPMPEVIDPTTFLRDPRAKSINGNRLGKDGCRFFGREIAMTKYEMCQNPAFFDVDKVGKDQYNSQHFRDNDFYSLIDQAKQFRNEAQNLQNNNPVREVDLGENTEHRLLEWYTFFDGKRCLVTLANDRSLLVRYQPLDSELWEVIDRPLYPNAHDWDGTSIPDLTEDKQRLRAIITNLMKDGLKSVLHPMYAYNSDKIKNRNDLTFGFNKFIPIKGDPNNAVTPINQINLNAQIADYVLNSLDVASQKATATPEIQQGVMPQQQRTLGELNLVASKSTSRYGLTAKVFGWSEKAFWRQWYYLYKTHFEDDIDEKLIRLTGAYGNKPRRLTRENIITTIDPDLNVESKVMSQARKLQEQLRFEKYAQLVVADPTANKRYVLRKLGRLNGLTKDELDRIFPLTADELMAEKENEALSENRILDVRVSPNDDHVLHMDIHAMATDTPATRAHIEAHREAIRMMKENPSLFPNASAQNFAKAGMEVPPEKAAMMQEGGMSSGGGQGDAMGAMQEMMNSMPTESQMGAGY